MIGTRTYLKDVLETDLTQHRLFSAGPVNEVHREGTDVLFTAKLLRKKPLPLFVRQGSEITLAEPVEHTGPLEGAERATIVFDESYHGLGASALGKWIQL